MADRHHATFRDEVLRVLRTVRRQLLDEYPSIILKDGAEPLADPLTDIYAQIAVEAAELTGLGISLTVRDANVIAFAEQHAGELVTRITEVSREAIRQAVTHGFIAGIAPRDTARTVRDVIGLTPQQATATINYRAGLEAVARGDATPAGVINRFALHDRRRGLIDLTPGKIDAMVDRYIERQLGWRAVNIARTETMLASNNGVLNGWLEAARHGMLAPGHSKVWIVTPDDRLCERCAPMDGQAVGLGALFGTVRVPPLHASCRCTVGLA